MSHSITIPFRYPDPIECREIPGFPGYRIGNDGSVWTSRVPGTARFGSEWRRMPSTRKPRGHLRVEMQRGGGRCAMYVHRLVLIAFVGPQPDGLECCHGPDNDPANNSVGNLRWDTRKSNVADMKTHGTDNSGERCSNAKLTWVIVIEIRSAYAAGGVFHRELAEKYGIARRHVTSICQGRLWKETTQQEQVNDNP